MERGHEIKVLDHGYVRYVESMGTDESIIESARMSTSKGFERWDAGPVCTRCGTTDPEQLCVGANLPGCGSHDHALKTVLGDAKLLDFMYRNKHSTPFEFCVLTVEVQAPIMVFREWHRHRTASYSEMSARYTQMPDIHYVPSLERMRASQQSTSNKQGSADGLDDYVAHVERANIEDEQRDIYYRYEEMLGKGIAKEVARLNTPVSRYSRMRATTDLRNWLGFLLLRMAPNAQWEIRQFANAVATIVRELWPRTYALFEEYDLHGVRLSRAEATRLYEIAFKSERDDALLQRLAAAANKLA